MFYRLGVGPFCLAYSRLVLTLVLSPQLSLSLYLSPIVVLEAVLDLPIYLEDRPV
jgi:hypothetical protein